MSNNNIKSDMGGGNSFYNIIRTIDSYDIFNNLILSGDLNGNITASSDKVWNHYDVYLFNHLQENIENFSRLIYHTNSGNTLVYKNKNNSSGSYPTTIRPVLECKE